MLAHLVLLSLWGAQEPATPGKPPAVPAEVKPLQSFSFSSASYPYHWDQLLPVNLEVDGLQVKTIFFNEREPTNRFLKGRKYGFRAQLEATNTSAKPCKPSFAVAVFDEEGRLLGAANGGTRLGTVKPGETETFDLNFSHVKQRLHRGSKFFLTIELRN